MTYTLYSFADPVTDDVNGGSPAGVRTSIPDGEALRDPDQVLYHLAMGARPEDLHPEVQPLARGYGVLFQSPPRAAPGLLGRVTAERQPDDYGGRTIERPAPSASLALDDRAPGLHIPSSRGPQGLQSVDGIPLESGQNAIPQFDGLIAEKVASFFQAMKDQGVPAQLRGGVRTNAGQSKVAGNKNGGAKPGNSLHEAGLAFDLNWDNLNATQRAKAVAAAKAQGFAWGGNFRKYDGEHFYVDPFASLSDRQAYIRELQSQAK